MIRAPGKTVAGRTYLHLDALDALDSERLDALRAAERMAGISRGEGFNVVRFEGTDPECGAGGVALLSYRDLFDAPFPVLTESWRVDLDTGAVGHRTYADSLNPPILHRKELLLPPGHPRRAEYAALTRACESISLFDEPTRIGYRRQWEQLVREKGYRVVGHQLVPIGNDERVEGDVADDLAPLHSGWEAARHLTALQRYGFSAPVSPLPATGSSMASTASSTMAADAGMTFGGWSRTG